MSNPGQDIFEGTKEHVEKSTLIQVVNTFLAYNQHHIAPVKENVVRRWAVNPYKLFFLVSINLSERTTAGEIAVCKNAFPLEYQSVEYVAYASG